MVRALQRKQAIWINISDCAIVRNVRQLLTNQNGTNNTYLTAWMGCLSTRSLILA